MQLKKNVTEITIIPRNIPTIFLSNSQINLLPWNDKFVSLKSWDYAAYCQKYCQYLVDIYKECAFSCKAIVPQTDIINKIFRNRIETHFLEYLTPTVLILDIPKQFVNIHLKTCTTHDLPMSEVVYHTNIHFDSVGNQSNKKHCLREILSCNIYPYILIAATYKCKLCCSSIVCHSEYFLNQLSLHQLETIPIVITSQNAICKEALYDVIDEMNLQVCINKISQLFAVKRKRIHDKHQTNFLMNCKQNNDIISKFPTFFHEDNSKYILECVKFIFESELFHYRV